MLDSFQPAQQTLNHRSFSPLRLRRTLVPACVAVMTLAGCSLQGSYTPDTEVRHVVLAGPDNFRDLGGYRTADGRTVKWGMLYRADDLDKLTRSDMASLDQRGIGTAFDFRAMAERSDRPDSRGPERCFRVEDLEISYEPLHPATLRPKILTGELAEAEAHELLLGANRAYVTLFRDRYARLINELSVADSLPAVFHCSMGKDRTGVAAALVLRALGVSKETVIEDYLLTNRYTEGRRGWVEGLVVLGSLWRQAPEDLRPLLEARREYIEAAFDTIDQEYGSFDAYLHEGLGLADTTLARLRSNLLDGALIVSASGVVGSHGVEAAAGVQGRDHP